MFNVGLGEILAIVLVLLLLFGPERLPEMARQVGRFLGKLRLSTQDALDQLKEEADLKDLSLPDLRIGSLRSQARDYVR
jgi:sec-independent protein translocase protein TatB